MQTYYFYLNTTQQVMMVQKQLDPLQDAEFIWIECNREDLERSIEQWQQSIYQLSQIRINEFHLQDLLNIDHPCVFDTLEDYDLLIFRKLITPDDQIRLQQSHKKESAIPELGLHTTPISFVITPQVLITVKEMGNKSLETYTQRIETMLTKPIDENLKLRKLPKTSLDLALRLLSTMVDGYLDLREPLTRRTEYWQRELLQGNRRFTKWHQLLQENMAFQQIENLCEEQIECLQELKDEIVDNYTHLKAKKRSERQDVALVRMNDLSSHIERIQKYTARLRSTVQSAIDLHFSAVANQTNENMRFLAIITAVFAPLTLLTGIYGMNFEFIPGLKSPTGFWLMLLIMAMTTLALLYYFYRRHLVGRGERSVIDMLAAQNKDSSMNLLRFLEEDPIQQTVKGTLKTVKKITGLK